MADQIIHWDRLNEAHRAAFARMLAPLIAASRSKDYETKEKATVQLHTWMLSMRDVSPVIIEEAIANLITAGVTWMPKPGELKAECAKVMTRKRLEAYEDSLPALCPTCHREKDYKGARWKEVSINGVDRLVQCDCRTVALEAADRVGQAIALPPSREDALEVGS